ncbi:hypothetical protein NL676_039531 [Syzygium grande]|nr:hypothetical protein NL676_039531 [Syzygium grande]
MYPNPSIKKQRLLRAHSKTQQIPGRGSAARAGPPKAPAAVARGGANRKGRGGDGGSDLLRLWIRRRKEGRKEERKEEERHSGTVFGQAKIFEGKRE